VFFDKGDIQYATHLAAILYMHSPMQIGRKPLQLPFLSVPLGTRAILEALSKERVSSESSPLRSLLIKGIKKLFLLSSDAAISELGHSWPPYDQLRSILE
jgi:hypothetical protein